MFFVKTVSLLKDGSFLAFSSSLRFSFTNELWLVVVDSRICILSISCFATSSGRPLVHTCNFLSSLNTRSSFSAILVYPLTHLVSSAACLVSLWKYSPKTTPATVASQAAIPRCSKLHVEKRCYIVAELFLGSCLPLLCTAVKIAQPGCSQGAQPWLMQLFLAQQEAWQLPFDNHSHVPLLENQVPFDKNC